MSKVQKAGRILRVGFALSKRAHFHTAYESEEVLYNEIFGAVVSKTFHTILRVALFKVELCKVLLKIQAYLQQIKT